MAVSLSQKCTEKRTPKRAPNKENLLGKSKVRVATKNTRAPLQDGDTRTAARKVRKPARSKSDLPPGIEDPNHPWLHLMKCPCNHQLEPSFQQCSSNPAAQITTCRVLERFGLAYKPFFSKFLCEACSWLGTLAELCDHLSATRHAFQKPSRIPKQIVDHLSCSFGDAGSAESESGSAALSHPVPELNLAHLLTCGVCGRHYPCTMFQSHKHCGPPISTFQLEAASKLPIVYGHQFDETWRPISVPPPHDHGQSGQGEIDLTVRHGPRCPQHQHISGAVATVYNADTGRSSESSGTWPPELSSLANLVRIRVADSSLDGSLHEPSRRFINVHATSYLQSAMDLLASGCCVQFCRMLSEGCGKATPAKISESHLGRIARTLTHYLSMIIEVELAETPNRFYHCNKKEKKSFGELLAAYKLMAKFGEDAPTSAAEEKMKTAMHRVFSAAMCRFISDSQNVSTEAYLCFYSATHPDCSLTYLIPCVSYDFVALFRYVAVHRLRLGELDGTDEKDWINYDPNATNSISLTEEQKAIEFSRTYLSPDSLKASPFRRFLELGRKLTGRTRQGVIKDVSYDIQFTTMSIRDVFCDRAISVPSLQHGVIRIILDAKSCLLKLLPAEFRNLNHPALKALLDIKDDPHKASSIQDTPSAVHWLQQYWASIDSAYRSDQRLSLISSDGPRGSSVQRFRKAMEEFLEILCCCVVATSRSPFSWDDYCKLRWSASQDSPRNTFLIRGSLLLLSPRVFGAFGLQLNEFDSALLNPELTLYSLIYHLICSPYYFRLCAIMRGTVNQFDIDLRHQEGRYLNVIDTSLKPRYNRFAADLCFPLLPKRLAPAAFESFLARAAPAFAVDGLMTASLTSDSAVHKDEVEAQHYAQACHMPPNYAMRAVVASMDLHRLWLCFLGLQPFINSWPRGIVDSPYFVFVRSMETLWPKAQLLLERYARESNSVEDRRRKMHHYIENLPCLSALDGSMGAVSAEGLHLRRISLLVLSMRKSAFPSAEMHILQRADVAVCVAQLIQAATQWTEQGFTHINPLAIDILDLKVANIRECLRHLELLGERKWHNYVDGLQVRNSSALAGSQMK